MLRIKIVSLAPLPVARALLAEASRAAFATADLAECASLAEASAISHDGALELLVVDQSALPLTPAPARPRWAVVALGADSIRLAVDGPSVALTLPVLTWVLRNAAERHGLSCENSRLRGDMKTVARRISHDLRSPLGCIRTSAEVLMETADDDAATRAGMAEVVRQSSDEIAELFDRTRFLLLASSDPVTPTAVEMGDVVKPVLRRMESAIRASGAILSLPATWPTVSGVPSWLEVVWENLLGNALRHGGVAPKIQVEWIAVPHGVRCSIADSGPGVASERVGGLFAPFDRLHAVRGPGLGLAMVHRLVELQGGSCGHGPSAVGGAAFHFTLPPAP